MDAASEAEKTSEFAPLLEMAGPEIFERNPFRVLDVPVRSTFKEIQRLHARRRMQDKLGMSGASQPPEAGPAASDDDVRRALERLNSPVERLLDELFWFWPLGTDNEDDALRALRAGRSEEAAAAWQQRISPSVEGQVALHNLVLLEHRAALEAEVREDADKLEAQDVKQRNSLFMRALAPRRVAQHEQERFEKAWHGIFANWKRLAGEDGFWDALKQRIRQLDDARLTTGLVRRLRSTLPLALLSINAQLALRLAERGSGERARRQITMLQGTAFGAQLADSAVKQALQQATNQIKAASDVARSRFRRTPHLGDEVVRDLRSQATGLLKAADTILPPGNPTRVVLHDMLAEAMLQGQLAFANKTEDWSTCIALADLGLEIAEGPSLKSRFAENRKVYEANLQTGNTWYTRSYWTLPAETIEVLEEQQKALTAGDVEGVIKSLVMLDPKHGKPLKRAFACALNRLAIRDYNAALRNVRPTPTMEALLARLKSMNYYFATPVPNASSWTPRPPCLACGRTSYTSWMNFIWRETRLFMCTDCWSKNTWEERDIERNALKEPVTKGLQCLLLANEVDPNDVGVVSNLNVLKTKAMEAGIAIPGSAPLRASLTKNDLRPVRKDLPATLEDQACYFCGRAAAVASYQIKVPMCDSRVVPVQMLLHRGSEYTTSTVAVPRCQACESHHRDLPTRINKWHEEKEAAADRKFFPLIAADVDMAASKLEAAEQAVREAEERSAQAQSQRTTAEQIGTYCRRCHHKYTHWKKSLCTQCDRQVFHLGWGVLSVVGAAATAAGCLAFLAEQKWHLAAGAWAPAVKAKAGNSAQPDFMAAAAGAAVFCLAVGAGYLVAKILQFRARRQLRALRKAECDQERTTAVGKATAAVEEASAFRTRAQADVALRRSENTRAREALEAARQKARRRFEALTPPPVLPAGIRPEMDFATYPKITTLVGQGWGFGTAPQAGLKVRTYPAGEVSGLVGTKLS